MGAGVKTQLVRTLVMMGQTAAVTDDLGWLEFESRESGTSEDVAGLAAAAGARAQLGQRAEAAALLLEADDLPGDAYVRSLFQGPMVRTALEIGQPAIAEQLVGRFVARSTYGEHARVASLAALAEAQGRIDEAIAGYTDAIARWDAFGVVPERAWAWLGLGRCLVERSADAAPALATARGLFESMESVPALQRCNELLRDG